MKKNGFQFQGELNGKKYTDLEQFTKELKRLTESGELTEMQYSYKSSSQTEEKAPKKPATNKKDISEDSKDRVSKIRDLVVGVAKLSEDISDKDEFATELLESMKDQMTSSFDKIKYLLSGMSAKDRKDFTESLLDEVKKMSVQADSEVKDLIYEEAKYRSGITEENQEIKKDIEDLQKDYDFNLLEMDYSKNRCDAAERFNNFFSDMVHLLEDWTRLYT